VCDPCEQARHTEGVDDDGESGVGPDIFESELARGDRDEDELAWGFGVCAGDALGGSFGVVAFDELVTALGEWAGEEEEGFRGMSDGDTHSSIFLAVNSPSSSPCTLVVS
jgi:hypothetical protein